MMSQSAASASTHKPTQIGQATLHSGQVSLAGQELNLAQSSDVARLKASLDDQELEALLQLMKLRLVAGPDGEFRLEPDDKFSVRNAQAETKLQGPSTDYEATDIELDLEREIIEQVFKPHGIEFPKTTAAAADLRGRIGNEPAVREAASKLQGMFGANSPMTEESFAAYMSEIMDRGPSAAERLLQIIKIAIKEDQVSKRDRLLQLRSINEMSKQVGEYLTYLVEKTTDINKKAADNDKPDKVTTFVTEKYFDTTSLDVDGKLHTLRTKRKYLNSTGISMLVKQVEQQKEDIGQKRAEVETSFKDLNSKLNQSLNIASTIVKTISQSRAGLARNFL